MSALNDLLAVQTTDIAISQAKHRVTHLQEAIDRDSAKKSLSEIDAQIAVCDTEIVAANTEITKVDRLSHEHDDKLIKLNKQLKTVIAPREAEALQHEIAIVTTERSLLDDRELELMGVVETAELRKSELGPLQVSAKSSLASATMVLSSVKQKIDAEIAALIEQRSAQALVVAPSLMSTYEAKRKHRPDGAVCRLTGPTCGSCHLDISQGEINSMRAMPVDEFPECPHCGSFIVF
ncbi:MAG: C4-type zinc ribbon domain-containing protein [Ilumatobacteraceae bacterium]